LVGDGWQDLKLLQNGDVIVNFGISLGFLAIVAAIYILWQIRQLLMLLFTAIVLATALNIVVKKFENWGIKRFIALPLSLSLLLTVVGVFFGTIARPFLDGLITLIILIPRVILQLNQWREEIVTHLDEKLIFPLPDISQAIASIERQLQLLLNQILGEGLSFFLTGPELPLLSCSS